VLVPRRPFKGYQTQPGLPTVQDTSFARSSPPALRTPLPAGRTDAGVHARMQVLSLRLAARKFTGATAALINAHLPPSVGIALARPGGAWLSTRSLGERERYRYRLLLADEPAWAEFGWRVDVSLPKLAPLLDAKSAPATSPRSRPAARAVSPHLSAVGAGATRERLEVRLRGRASRATWFRLLSAPRSPSPEVS